MMMFNAAFNNILVIWRQSDLLVEETGENGRPVASNLIFIESTSRMSGIGTHNVH